MFFTGLNLRRYLPLLLLATSPAWPIEDLYERGTAEVEWYHPWREGTNFAEHHFSPFYHPDDPDAFWDRVDKERPTVPQVVHDLWAMPKHLIWDTPINMGLNLKRDYFDTFRESETGLEITQDVVTGIPHTAMVGVNGIYDSVTHFYTDVYTPILVGGLILTPIRWLSSLTEPAPAVYNVVDIIPKTLWGVALPVRKVLVTGADEVQKGTNFIYRTVTDPVDIADHANRYWPGPPDANYSPPTYVPETPGTTIRTPNMQR
jgi:hypothetical protein